MKILVTGAAGFIGSFVARRLAGRGDEVVGLDSLDGYYDVGLKLGRLTTDGIDADGTAYGEMTGSAKYSGYRFIKLKLEDKAAVDAIFAAEKFDAVCHLAAQAGVRYSGENPYAYLDSNITAFLNILEACRANPVRHLVYASSSSVYGANTKLPFSEDDRTDSPVSFYAATKKAGEIMTESYSRLYGIPATGLRFFTVYGPWGRPDMAAMLFARAMLDGEAIGVYNNGEQSRDFTYIDDITEGVVRVIGRAPVGEPPHEIYNIGHGSPVKLMDFITALENELGVGARLEMMPAQPGDVRDTWADCSKLERDFGYAPRTPLAEGLRRFVEWYKNHYTL